MDPWRDVALSLDPTTRARSQYAMGNPVSYTDPNGHCVPRPVQGPNPTTGPNACPGGEQNVTEEELDDKGPGCYTNCGPNRISVPGPHPRPRPTVVTRKAAEAYQAYLLRHEDMVNACVDGGDPYACRDANRATSAAWGAVSSRCNETLSNLIMGSNGCDGTTAGEGAWNVAVTASWFVGIGELRAGAQITTKGAMHVFGDDATRGVAELSDRAIAERIANGHAFNKHVVGRGEFAGVRTQAEFADVISQVMTHGSTRHLQNGRTAYWYRGVIVLHNPKAADLGTAFVPDNGFQYFMTRK